MKLQAIPQARFEYEGVAGARIRANVEGWLNVAPAANPGMLEMFRVRDRRPVPKLVPWAGEFAGKYLIGAIQALRMSDDPRLERTVRGVLKELIAAQAPNGYLGPFPQSDELQGNWDLWGHYHWMQALLMWHERTGDAEALGAARRAADLMAETFLTGTRRVYDAGWHEMNMAVIHVLGRLYRATGEPRTLQLMKEIEKDWERAGDYLRTGLAGTEFHRTPRPRWESLPDLQGLAELWRITGDEKYRTAFLHHWRSIREWDRHVNGSFSTGELALGNPYAPGAIETCCTVAWMALSVDMLQLTGDAAVADELELSTLNGAAAAQHPSGRWYTYDTPMDGVREASAHTIVFQSRAGTPELNCCSVNGPRAWGMLSEWMVLTEGDGYRISSYLPGRIALPPRADGSTVTLRIESDYPLDGEILIRVDADSAAPFPIHFRIPPWAAGATLAVNDGPPEPAAAGASAPVLRKWAKGDRVRLHLPMSLRYEMGARELLNKASLFYGPLNLAYDQRENPMDPQDVPALDLKQLASAEVIRVKSDDPLAPWLRVTVATTSGPLTLVDFASAGARGTSYVSWLPVDRPPPPPAQTVQPKDGETVPAAGYVFKWTGPAEPAGGLLPFRLSVHEDADASRAVISEEIASNSKLLTAEDLGNLQPGRDYFWSIESRNAQGSRRSTLNRFRTDAWLPAPAETAYWGRAGTSPIAVAALDAQWQPAPGSAPAGFTRADGPSSGTRSVELDGKSQRLHFDVGQFPEPEFTFRVRFNLRTLPTGRLGQIVSAWASTGDDPLRICVENGKLFVRVEAGLPSGSPGVAVEADKWYDLALVKQGPAMRLYLNGELRDTAGVPNWINTRAKGFALGGNPRAPVDEHLHARFSDVRFFGGALSESEVKALHAAAD